MENAKFRRLSSWYSFALPGLGQVYQGRYVVGLVFFLIFAGLAMCSSAVLWLPIVAILSGLETRRAAGRQAGKTPGWAKELETRYADKLRRARLPFFTLVAGLGLASWAMLLGAKVLPFGAQMEVSERADWFAERVKGFRARRGVLPRTLEEVVEEKERARLIDPWGSAFRLQPSDGGFRIDSAGRDKTFQTKDDLVYRFR